MAEATQEREQKETKQTTKDRLLSPGALGALAAATAAAAGAYWFFGSKDAKKHRTEIKSWMLQARADVMDAVSKLKDIDRDTYLNIVDRVMQSYATIEGGLKTPQMLALASDLRGAWTHIKELRSSSTGQRAKTSRRSAVRGRRRKASAK